MPQIYVVISSEEQNSMITSLLDAYYCPIVTILERNFETLGHLFQGIMERDFMTGAKYRSEPCKVVGEGIPD